VKEMKCVILAAGEGKRMHPLTFTRPKVMLPIGNTPILECNLENAIKSGLSEFIFVVGYKSEMVRNYFGNGKQWNVQISYVNQGKALGTAHAIGMVERFADECIVLCGDTIFGSGDIQTIANRENSMGLLEIENPGEYGVVKTKGHHIERIYEKMQQPISHIINAGIYHFSSNIFKYIKKTKKSLRGEFEITDSLNMMLDDYTIEGVFLKNWRDVVYPWDLLEANREILSTMNGTNEGSVDHTATLKETVAVGKDTKILSGSYIEGPVSIGRNCKIGPNCYIRPYTAIGNNCHIGNACEVKNSIVYDNSNIPHQNYIGDTVLGSNCNLGAGTKIANLRLDKKNIKVILNGKKINTQRRKLGAIIGDNVQTGINATLNVGTIIGNNCFIGQGASIKGELLPNSIMM
jgi:bifunctional UDP-N-acetylglucosamine pyrophosphorylase/glucosamine-1-phosphate N-acetyltransferase